MLRYRDYLLGVISDVEFPRNRRVQPETGFQSGAHDSRHRAGCAYRAAVQPHRVHGSRFREGFRFLQKHSPTLLGDLRRIFVGQGGLRRLRLPPCRRRRRSDEPPT